MTLNDSGEISLLGGEGIGTVTRKGIGLPTGSPAINRTPRHTIETAVREAIGPSRARRWRSLPRKAQAARKNL